MPEQYRKIGAPVETTLVLFRNAALWDQVARARLVVGGPAHAQVLISQQADLVVAVPMSVQEVIGLANDANGQPNIVIPERLHYSAAEVMIGDRIYRTWMAASATPEVHVMQTLVALADAEPKQVETCRVA